MALKLRRHKYRGTKLTTLLLLSLLLPAGPDSIAADPGQNKVDRSEKEARASQCGFGVAVFALEYFRLDHDPDLVYKVLRPSSDGILLSDIHDTLVAHGLDVRARKEFTLADLREGLQGAQLAVLPIQFPHGEKHYCIVMRHATRGLLVVDPPAGVGDLADKAVSDSLEARWKELGRLCLFVRRDKQPGSQRERITVKPDVVDLGTFSDSDPQSLSARVEEVGLANTGDKAVMVERMTLPCGCLKTDWSGGIIAPKKTVLVPFAVDPRRWGAGSEKSLTIYYHDGSQHTVTFKAKPTVAKRLQAFQVSPDVLRINLAEEGQRTQSLERTAVLSFDPMEPPGTLSLSTRVPWLRGKIESLDSSSARLSVRILVGSEEVQKATGTLHGDLEIASKTQRDPVKLSVTLYRSSFFQIAPSLLKLKGGSSQVPRVLVYPTPTSKAASNPKERLSVVKVWPEATGLELEFAPQQAADGPIVISCHAKKIPPAGYYLIKCLVQNSRKEQAVGSFVLQVDE